MASYAFGGFDSVSSDDDSNDEPTVRNVDHQISSTFLDLESSDEDQEKRVVRSEKDKRWEELRTTIRGLRNHIKINDWVAISADFDELLRICERAARKVGVPRFFVKQMLQLEELTQATLKEKDKVKKMKKPNFRALNSMRQNIKKRFRGPYTTQIEAYLKNPLEDEEDESEAEASEEEDVRGIKLGSVMVADLTTLESDEEVEAKEDAEDEGDEEEWSDDDWEVDEDDEDDDMELESHGHAIFTRDFWVKKVKDTDKAADSEKKSRVQRQLERAEAKAQHLKEARERAAAAAEKGKAKPGKHEVGEITQDLVMRKLKEVLDSRGKRGVDRSQTIQNLENLLKRVEDNPKISAALSLKVKTTLAQAYFETSLNAAATHMPVDLWKKCVPVLQSILTELMVNPLVRLTEDEEIESSIEDSLQGPGERISNEEVQKLMSEVSATQKTERQEAEDRRREELEVSEGGQTVYVQGNLFSFISHMATEYMKSLRALDPLQSEYVNRLKDESTLVILIAQSEQYYRKIDKRALLVRIVSLRLEYLYYVYHRDQDVLAYLPEDRAALEKDPLKVDLEAIGKASVRGQAAPAAAAGEEDEDEDSKYATRASYPLIRSLATYLYQHGDPRSKLRALLCHIFYLALHNHYREAREYILMSYLQDVIDKADILTRILYNRTLTQLGLAAFRRGELRQCLESLNEMNQTNRVKELLAQGTSRQAYGQRDPAKEQAERRRLLPYHMHINLEAFEGVTLISAMSVDIPSFSRRGGFGDSRFAASRNFHRLLEKSKLAFNGPPESTRDFVVAASHSMLEGDWKTCWSYVEKLNLWKIVPEAATVKQAVRRSLQLSALSTFLFRFAEFHTSLSIQRLEENFELPPEVVKQTLSRMIHEDELRGALELETGSVVLHKALPNKLQRTALRFADKVVHFVDSNDRISDHSHRGRGGYRGGFRGGFRGGRGRGGGQGRGSGPGRHSGGGDRKPATEASASSGGQGQRWK